MSQEGNMEGTYKERKSDSFDRRCGRRLRDELGVNPAGVEVILRLRTQILDLQAQLQELEAELAERYAGRRARLTRYHEFFYEVAWYDIGFPEEDE